MSSKKEDGRCRRERSRHRRRERRRRRHRRSGYDVPHFAAEDGADAARGRSGSRKRLADDGDLGASSSSLCRSRSWSQQHRSSSSSSSSRNGAPTTGCMKKNGAAAAVLERGGSTVLAGSAPPHPARPPLPSPPSTRSRDREGGNGRGRSLSSMARTTNGQSMGKEARAGHCRSLVTLRHARAQPSKAGDDDVGASTTLPLIDTNGRRLERSKTPSRPADATDSRKAAGDLHKKAPAVQQAEREISKSRDNYDDDPPHGAPGSQRRSGGDAELSRRAEPEIGYGDTDSSRIIVASSSSSRRSFRGAGTAASASSPRRGKSASRSRKGNDDAAVPVPVARNEAREGARFDESASGSKRRGLSRSRNRTSVPSNLMGTRAKRNQLSRSLNRGAAPTPQPADLHSSTDVPVSDKTSEGEDDAYETTETTGPPRMRIDGTVFPSPPSSVHDPGRSKHRDPSSSSKFVAGTRGRVRDVVRVLNELDGDEEPRSERSSQDDEAMKAEDGRSAGPTGEARRRHRRRREGRGRSKVSRSGRSPANGDGNQCPAATAAASPSSAAAVKLDRRHNAVVASATTEFDDDDVAASGDESRFTKQRAHREDKDEHDNDDKETAPPSNGDVDDDDADAPMGRSIGGIVARVRELSKKSSRRFSSRSASRSRSRGVLLSSSSRASPRSSSPGNDQVWSRASISSSVEDPEASSLIHCTTGRGSNSSRPSPDLHSIVDAMVCEESEDWAVASHQRTHPPPFYYPRRKRRECRCPRRSSPARARVPSDRDEYEGTAASTGSTTGQETSSTPNGPSGSSKSALDLGNRSDGSTSVHRSVSFLDQVDHTLWVSALSSSMTSQESQDGHRASALTSSMTGHGSQNHRALSALSSSTTISQDQFLPCQQQLHSRLVSDRVLRVPRRVRSLSRSHNTSRDTQIRIITSDYPSSFAANHGDRPGSPPASAPRKARSLSRTRDVAVRHHVDFDPPVENVIGLPRRGHHNEPVVFKRKARPLERIPIQKSLVSHCTAETYISEDLTFERFEDGMGDSFLANQTAQMTNVGIDPINEDPFMNSTLTIFESEGGDDDHSLVSDHTCFRYQWPSMSPQEMASNDDGAGKHTSENDIGEDTGGKEPAAKQNRCSRIRKMLARKATSKRNAGLPTAAPGAAKEIGDTQRSNNASILMDNTWKSLLASHQSKPKSKLSKLVNH